MKRRIFDPGYHENVMWTHRSCIQDPAGVLIIEKPSSSWIKTSIALSAMRRKQKPTLSISIPPLSNTMVLSECRGWRAMTQADTVTPLLQIFGFWKHLFMWIPRSTNWDAPLRYSAEPTFPGTSTGFPMVVPLTKPWRVLPVKTSMGNTASAAGILYVQIIH